MTLSRIRRIGTILTCALLAWGLTGAATAAVGAGAGADPTVQYRRWIADMKENPRGPFSSIKWFCKDGRVLGPKDYACAKKG